MFDPKLAEVIHHAMAGLQLDNPEVTEYTFMFFSNMSKLLKTDFEPVRPWVARLVVAPGACDVAPHAEATLCGLCVQFLETLVPVLMDVVRSNDGVAYSVSAPRWRAVGLTAAVQFLPLPYPVALGTHDSLTSRIVWATSSTASKTTTTTTLEAQSWAMTTTTTLMITTRLVRGGCMGMCLRPRADLHT